MGQIDFTAKPVSSGLAPYRDQGAVFLTWDTRGTLSAKYDIEHTPVGIGFFCAFEASVDLPSTAERVELTLETGTGCVVQCYDINQAPVGQPVPLQSSPKPQTVKPAASNVRTIAIKQAKNETHLLALIWR